MATSVRVFMNALQVYWRTIFVILYPIALLSIIITNHEASMRCFYIVLLMAGYWVTEALPLPVTALIPLVLFPLLGVLDSDITALCYLQETNMMFIGGLVIAIAVEHSNLHRRVALSVILLVGCSPRKLNFGLMAVSMFVSMWISNTAAIAMMCPIIEATLHELESQGVGNNDTKATELETGDVEKQDEQQGPSKTTICYFISAAYAVSIGGLGCIIGSGTNLTFKGIYESRFPDSPGILFTAWMLLNVPIMLITTFLIWIYMQVLYMGLFRPRSEDAKRIRMGPQGESAARKIIRQKLEEMGPMTFHQGAVACTFFLSVLLWFFRKPQFITGWAEIVTDKKVHDSTAALIVVLLLFIIPAKPDFIYIFSKDESKRPKTPSPPLVTWKVVQQKLPWGLIFLLGGGFALAAGSKESGMSKMIAHHLEGLLQLPKFLVMVLSCVFASTLTEFSSNVAVANVILPVLADMSKLAKWHPLYLMLPAAISCSHAFCLPVGTPPNAIVVAPSNIPTKEMVKSGIGVSVISMVILLIGFYYLGEVIYDVHTYPEWAD